MTFIPLRPKDGTQSSNVDPISQQGSKNTLLGRVLQSTTDPAQGKVVARTDNGDIKFKTPSGDVIVDKQLTVSSVGSLTANNDIIFARVGNYYLACAPASKRTQKQWGLYGTDTSIPNVSTEHTYSQSGYDNSLILDSYGVSAEANSWCRGRSGASYFLPSREELILIWINRGLIDTLDNSGGTYTLGYIANSGSGPADPSSGCWSSTEKDTYESWRINMSVGSVDYILKNNINQWVLPVTRIAV